MAEQRADLLQGTLGMLILKTVSLQPLHGLGVARRIEQITGGIFRVQPGSLFPALHRLEQEGWIAGEWGESENGRRAKFYRLTKTGRRQLREEQNGWSRLAAAVSSVLEAT